MFIVEVSWNGDELNWKDHARCDDLRDAREQHFLLEHQWKESKMDTPKARIVKVLKRKHRTP